MATIILAGGITAITGLSSRSLVRTRLNQQYDRAWQLLDRQLTLIDAMGIDQFLEQRTSQGSIEDGDLIFQWEVDATLQEIDQLYLITIRVKWLRGQQLHTITASTCLNGPDIESTQTG